MTVFQTRPRHANFIRHEVVGEAVTLPANHLCLPSSWTRSMIMMILLLWLYL